MQNQSFSLLPGKMFEVSLDPDFPCYMHHLHHHTDRPIHFLHAHSCLEIGYCHEGTGIFVIESQVLPFAAGDITIIGDSQMHLARSTVGTTSLWTWLYLDPVRLITLPPRDQHLLAPPQLSRPGFPYILRPAVASGLAELVRQMIDELQNQPSEFKTAVRGLVCTLMGRLSRLLPPAGPTVSHRRSLHRIAKALEYFAGHYPETIHITDIANLCHVSMSTLRRLFLSALGLPPQEYLIRLRIQMAASLLAGTDRPILEIASGVGFETLSSFNRQFKNQTGFSPREWRKQNLSG